MQKGKSLLFLGLMLLSSLAVHAQIEPFRIEDTSAFFRDMFLLKNKYYSLSFTGYLQVQYQYADSNGIRSYNGGNFSPDADNRFMIRRGRIRADYERKNKEGYNTFYFALQFDGTERGMNIRDMFGRIYENRWNCLVATMGVFNRPFGYELRYSSVYRESPERGRMSQILMGTERDLGVMVSFDAQDKNHRLYPLRLDVGVFNGQGLTGPVEYDKYKDIIANVAFRRTEVVKRLFLSGGVSWLNGGFRTGSRYFYSTGTIPGDIPYMLPDISDGNIGEKAPRIYYGADLQVSLEHRLGKTEARAEFITGTQSATYASSVTPGTPPLNSINKPDSIYKREFNGAYLYLLHTFLKKHQFLLKYDWYDPNTDIAGSKIKTDHGFSPADIRYDTFGAGYNYYLNDNVKILLWFDHPVNEHSSIGGYSKDLKDNTYTARVQFRF